MTTLDANGNIKDRSGPINGLTIEEIKDLIPDFDKCRDRSDDVYERLHAKFKSYYCPTCKDTFTNPSDIEHNEEGTHISCEMCDTPTINKLR